jgi:hypothetical protein
MLFNLPSFRLYGMQDSNPHLLLKSKSSSSSSAPLLHFEFELFPINKRRSDYRFHFNLQPINIIYDAVSYNKISERYSISKICDM